MLNVLGIGLDYNSIVKGQTRGDFNDRLKAMSGYVNQLNRIIYSPAGSNLEDIEIEENIKIYFSNSKDKFVFIKDAVELTAKILSNNKIDIITAEDSRMAGLVGLAVKRKFNIPLNVQINDGRINNSYWLRERKKNYFLNVLAKFILKRADSVRVVSYRAKDALIKCGIEEDKIFVVPTFIFTDNFENVNGSEIRNKYISDKYKRIILFMGRLSKEKDLPTIFRAIKKVVEKIPSTLLLVVGSGPEENVWKELCLKMELNNNVKFVGPIEYHEVPKYFAACDIIVLSSLHEGKPRVLVEAGLSKKAIVATDAGDSSKCVIEGKTGYIVNIGDDSAMADKILHLLRNPELLASFGEEGYKFTLETVAKEHTLEALIECWDKTKANYSKRTK